MDPFDLAFEEYKSDRSALGRSFRVRSQSFDDLATPCALCHAPLKRDGPRTTSYPCGHVFHKRCANASGTRSASQNPGGCPFCDGFAKWEFRKHSRWLPFPPSICRRLDVQTRKRGPDIVVYDQRL